MVRQKLNERLPSWAKVGFGTLHLKASPDFYRTKKFVFKNEGAFRTFFTYGATALYAVIGLMLVNLFAILNVIPSNTLTTLPSSLWQLAPVQLNKQGIAILISVGLPIVILHELGHALAAFAYRIDTKSVGFVFLLGVLPVYAYVEQDFDPLTERDPHKQLRVATAGITIQTVLAIVTLPLVVLALGGIPPFAPEPTGLVGLWFSTFFIINVQLAIINAFPIQVLDGGNAYWSLATLVGKFLTGEEENSVTNALLSIRTVVVLLVLFYLFF